MHISRRAFVTSLASAGVLAPTLFVPSARGSAERTGHGLDAAVAAVERARLKIAGATADPVAVAADPAYWTDVQQAWAVDRTILNLENGGLQPAPAIVNQVFIRHWLYANEAPSYTNANILWSQVEGIRARLAQAFGCDTEEMAITRNTTEGFLTAAMGIKLAPGDEVLTTTQDYHRFRNAFLQRQNREGVVLRTIQLPVPVEDDNIVVQRFEEAITPRTRVILLSHMFQLTGQIMPIRDVVRMARKHGILVIVDGAHGFAHIPARRDDLECDIYTTSLHKWLSAPHGTGFLYVRKALIPSIWPLQPPTQKSPEDIRKFEAIGTASAAPYLAIGDALDFWAMIGPERKTARLRWLRERWVARIAGEPGVKLNTSRLPGRAGAIVNFEMEDLPPVKLAAWLWDKHRVLVAGVEHPEFKGLRVVPALYTTEAELDRFVHLLFEARRTKMG